MLVLRASSFFIRGIVVIKRSSQRNNICRVAIIIGLM
jgi:hypothetical protein